MDYFILRCWICCIISVTDRLCGVCMYPPVLFACDWNTLEAAAAYDRLCSEQTGLQSGNGSLP